MRRHISYGEARACMSRASRRLTPGMRAGSAQPPLGPPAPRRRTYIVDSRGLRRRVRCAVRHRVVRRADARVVESRPRDVDVYPRAGQRRRASSNCSAPPTKPPTRDAGPYGRRGRKPLPAYPVRRELAVAGVAVDGQRRLDRRRWRVRKGTLRLAQFRTAKGAQLHHGDLLPAERRRSTAEEISIVETPGAAVFTAESRQEGEIVRAVFGRGAVAGHIAVTEAARHAITTWYRSSSI